MSADRPFILAFGDSLTAGYGLEPSGSFAARLQVELRQRWPGAVVHNAGVSGDTTEGGLVRLPRVLASLWRRPDLAIVELGVNDCFRGVPPARTRANLDSIVHELARCAIPTLLATFEAPRWLGALGTAYADIHAEVAARHGAATAPFFPPGVLGHPELVLPDQIHPNARAIELVATAFVPAVLRLLDRGHTEAA